MFNIGFAELILIMLVAFIIVGPQDLPKVARALGRAVKWIRNMIREIKAETGFDDLEKEFKGIQTEMKGVSKDIQQTLKEADVRQDLKKEFDGIGKELKTTGKEVSDSLKEAESDAKKTVEGK